MYITYLYVYLIIYINALIIIILSFLALELYSNYIIIIII